MINLKSIKRFVINNFDFIINSNIIFRRFFFNYLRFQLGFLAFRLKKQNLGKVVFIFKLLKHNGIYL